MKQQYVVQRLSFVQLSATPWTAACQASLPHRLLKFVQVHINCISYAIQPSHPLMLSSSSSLNLSQHQGLFQWVDCSNQMIKILELQLQHQFFQWILRISLKINWFPLRSPCSPRHSKESSPAPQFKGINSLMLCLLCGPALTTVCDHWEDHRLDYNGPLLPE